MNRPIDCRSTRRFGVEIELNTFDGIIKRADSDNGIIPEGSDCIANIVKKNSNERVEICCWDHYHNNSNWIIKHDMSCGIEINTPVFKGWHGLKTLLQVVEALSKNSQVTSNQLCSLHVHVGVSDLSLRQIASVIAHYIKCEHIFFDSVPSQRKNNRYCHLVGLTDWFDTSFDMDASEIINRVSQAKYASINAYHFMRSGGLIGEDSRATIEFRIAENKACLDPYYVKNWVRFLIHFVETMSCRKIPQPYNGNPKTGLVWLDFQDVYSLLRFDEELSLGMQQVRQWFMDRIFVNGQDNLESNNIWSSVARKIAREQFLELNNKLTRIDDAEDGLYGEKWIA